MNRTLFLAAAFGLMVGLGWAVLSHRGSLSVVGVDGPHVKVLGAGNDSVATVISLKSQAGAKVAARYLNAGLIDDAKSVIESLAIAERGAACEEAFMNFYKKPPVLGGWDAEDLSDEEKLKGIAILRGFAEICDDSDRKALMLSALSRQRETISDSNISPTQAELLLEARSALMEPSSRLPGTPWYSAILTGLFAAVTSAVGWKLLEAASGEIGKSLAQTFVLGRKHEETNERKKSADNPSEDNKVSPEPIVVQTE